MTEKIRLKISPTVARFVRPGVANEEKLGGLAKDYQLEPFDRVTLLFCLSRDTDSMVKGAAASALAALPDDVLTGYVQSAEAHPSVLDALAVYAQDRPQIAQALIAHSLLSNQVRDMLRSQLEACAAPPEPPLPEVSDTETSPDIEPLHLDTAEDDAPADEEDLPDEEPAEINEEDEQYLSKYKIAQIMGISEKIKMALSGDKEWRAILIKDANKLVSSGVIKNPRLSDGEVLQFLKLGIQSDEIIRLICANREWVKNYNIRKALINCPKTPLANSLRYLGTLTEKDLAGYAKSKNVNSVISTQAKRMLLAKKR